MGRYWTFDCVPQYQAGVPALSKDALADQLTHACFNVSAYHQLVGDVIRYMIMPNNMVWHIREGEDMADAKALLLALDIAAKTMRDMPELIGDEWFFDVWVKHIVVPTDSEVRRTAVQRLLDTLKADLTTIRATIQRANEIRPEGLRPDFWACSVSV